MIAAARSNLARLLPNRRDYAELPRFWRRDIVAGITVGVVALPLALAFGISSGVGAAAGVVTAVIAGLVAAVFGGSHVQASGLTGAMAVVLAPIVAQYGLGSIALVTVLAGLILLAAGATGLGRAVTFIPWPVIEGFMLGIAAIIFLQQAPAAFGQDTPAGGRTLTIAWDVVTQADWSAARTLAVVAVVAGRMVMLPRLHRGIPESLTAVVVVTIGVVALDFSGRHHRRTTVTPTQSGAAARGRRGAPRPRGCGVGDRRAGGHRVVAVGARRRHHGTDRSGLGNPVVRPGRSPDGDVVSDDLGEHCAQDPALHPLGRGDVRADRRHHGVLRPDRGGADRRHRRGVLRAARSGSAQ